MKKCVNCGFENDDDEACCTECGKTEFTAVDVPARSETILAPPDVNPMAEEKADEVVEGGQSTSESEAPNETPPAGPSQHEYEFAPLSAEDRQKDLVTLVGCRTLSTADYIVCRLRAAGIEAFIPDQNLMQWVGWNFNTYGYVRVQIAPKDYEAAKDLLAG
jgi:cell division septation protein DedD